MADLKSEKEKRGVGLKRSQMLRSTPGAHDVGQTRAQQKITGTGVTRVAGEENGQCFNRDDRDLIVKSKSSILLGDGDGDKQTSQGHDQAAPRTPDVLSFLENDSPPVTQESILQAIAQASEHWSPRSISSFGSLDSSRRSASGTDTTTPDQSINGGTRPSTASDPTSASRAHANSEGEVHDRYGTPEMARGPAKHPHLAPSELQPRLVAPGQGYPKYLPRAEKLPMSGYELLAAKLSGSHPSSSRSRRRSSGTSTSSDGDDEYPAIRPIYRKFAALNHRLLLHLQDELSELEEQLHRLDTADTQKRRLQNCILPASRRAEFMAGGELQWRKTDILGKIGFKLGQYNHALESFTKTLRLPAPSAAAVEHYRTYLATHHPIAEVETRFLDHPAADLACLAPDTASCASRSPSPSPSSSSWRSTESSDGLLTPVPRRASPASYGSGGAREVDPDGAATIQATRRSSSPASSGSRVRSPWWRTQQVERDRPQQQQQLLTQQQQHAIAGGTNRSPAAAPRISTAAPANPLWPSTDDSTARTAPDKDRSPAAAQTDHNPADVEANPDLETQTAILATAAALAPIVTFRVVHDFVGRVAVVVVAGLAVAALTRRLHEMLIFKG
ncbi:9626d9c7-87fe-4e92-8ae2-d0684e32a6e7 [Thermothielavioides terrestris]|uniref:9626d9c7-87fe-4e92-8ae2-d0684e32a6e7 n=1 Tax=Thermothielavioides terrestris TaxID=2587410 RepID=A0A3S4F561_9PEZI|nr:9626d9c7-87fe-4e92-8ae2-d0684e32a6e7 [Thermothielavioides terrestris]